MNAFPEFKIDCDSTVRIIPHTARINLIGILGPPFRDEKAGDANRQAVRVNLYIICTLSILRHTRHRELAPNKPVCHVNLLLAPPAGTGPGATARLFSGCSLARSFVLI